MKFSTIRFVIILLLSGSIRLISGSEDTVFIYNHIENCKLSDYYDVNYFLCLQCDPQSNLVPSANGLRCECNAKSTTKVLYDANLRQPICLANNCTNSSECNNRIFSSNLNSPQMNCGLQHLIEVISTSPPLKSIQIIQIPSKLNEKNQTSNVSCADVHNPSDLSNFDCIDPKNYVRYDKYCIPNYLLNDYLNYKLFRVSSMQNGIIIMVDLFENMEFLIFLCQTMKMLYYCEHVANLCVLTVYNLDKFSPCNIFYTMQTTLINTGVDTYQIKLVPFLFYAKGRSVTDDLDKVIDFRYKFGKNIMDYDSEEYGVLGPYMPTNRISMLMVAHSLNGDLQKIQPMKLDDLNFCSTKQQSIHFGENLASSCQIDLKTLIEMGERRPWFYNLYLNYSESSLPLVKTVPVLIRNAFTYNMLSGRQEADKWQLVKRFFLIDAITGRNKTYRTNAYVPENYFDKYSQIRYARRIELQFKLHANHYYFGNKITVPLLIIEYGFIEMHSYSPDVDIDFEFRVTFTKDFELSIFFHIIFTMSLVMAVGMAIFQTISFKRRKQQQNDIDSLLLVEFCINCCSTIGTVLFASAATLIVYIYFVYKTQYVVRVLPPFSELRLIKFFFCFAFILKLVKFCYHLGYQMNSDIFFIDWERPKVFEHQITLKSTNNLDTPSICSSARQYQQNDGLSAWRMYFVANEWIKLSIKRKCSIGIQILMILLTIIIFRFDWWYLFTFKSMFHWPWTPDADRIIRNGRSLEMLAIGLIVYTVCYAIQRLFNFLIYERFILNSIQQFIDICSMSNISMFIFAIDSYGYYVHGRSPHGFADTDMCTMLQQLRRESENMCGHRGLLPNSEHQTFCFIAPLQLRSLYNKLKSTLPSTIEQTNGPQNYQQNSSIETTVKFQEPNLQKIAHTNTTINRFLSAFIDHGLKDLDYIIQEKSLLEYMFDFEFDSNVTESRGTFFMDNNGFDSALFYGNEQLLFQVEILFFIFVIIITGNFLFSLLFLGVVCQIIKHTIRILVKKNLSKQTLIDEKFLI